MKRVIPAYKTLLDVLQDAIDKEQDAADFYAEAAEMAQTADVKEFLLDMARMERDHYEMLSRRLAQLKAERDVMNGILSSYEDRPSDHGA